MSFRDMIKKYFSGRAETSEEHVDTTLRPRYYKTTKDKGMATLENLFDNSQAYILNSTSKDHGEITLLRVKGKKAFVVLTVVMISPYRTSVDISFNTESILPFDFGYSTREIQRLYETINKELTLIDK